MYRKTYWSLILVLIFVGTSWGQEVTLKGKPLTLMGEKMQLGQTFPTVLLPDLGLKMIGLQSFQRQSDNSKCRSLP